MKRNIVRVHLIGQGDFVAELETVANKLTTYTKRSMINECCDVWPELLRDRTWTRAYLRSLPSFVLAVILCQL